MSENKQLPEGWRSVKIKEIGKVKGGKRLPKGHSYSDTKTAFPYLRVTDFKNLSIAQEKLKYIEINTQQLIRNYIIHKNDVFISIAGTIGQVGVVPDNLDGANLTENAAKITELYATYNRYLAYYLSSKTAQTQIAENTIATTQPKLSLFRIDKIEIPLPPLAEQHRIVAKIEELFTNLDKGIESLKTAQQQLKIYRQAVLKWAFEGKLTNKGVMEGELPEGWKWVKSMELFDFVTSGSRGWAKYYSASGAIFIRITNLNFDTLKLDLRPEKVQYVKPPQNSEGIRTKVQEGDFLFSITGYLGMFAIAPKLDDAYVNQHVCLCRPSEGFNSKFVAYWIIAKSGAHHHLNKDQKGAVKAGLTLGDLKSFPVPIAPLEEQDQIVAEIESRLSVCDKIEETISQSLQQAESLRQSILKKAFEGTLVLQDPNDEPASVLLERIRAERQVQVKIKPVKTKKVKKMKVERVPEIGEQLTLL